jgi:Tfp pilus assembly protein PilP
MTHLRRQTWTTLFGATCLVSLTACLEIPPPKPPPTPAAAAATVDPAAAAAAEEASAAAYAYAPVGKRDPFRDPATLAGKRPVARGPNEQLTALQRFELDQLSLLFTNTATASPIAMVGDPSGRTHVVQIGDFIGKNWGKVSNIKRDELQITETIADENNRVYPVFIPLRMKRVDEENAQDAMELKVLANQ